MFDAPGHVVTRSSATTMGVRLPRNNIPLLLNSNLEEFKAIAVAIGWNIDNTMITGPA